MGGDVQWEQPLPVVPRSKRKKKHAANCSRIVPIKSCFQRAMGGGDTQLVDIELLCIKVVFKVPLLLLYHLLLAFTRDNLLTVTAVSYTHLTLPTRRTV